MYDVIVVGGGISGAVAAIAACRSGAKTLLIEQYGFLGGALTSCGVGPMMTFHVLDKQVVKGITGEVIERMKSEGKSPGHVYDTTGTTYTVTPFDAEGMKYALEDMLIESGGEILYHTMLAGVETKDSKISKIKVCNKAGLSDLEAKVYVDATGDGDLSAWSGVETVLGKNNSGDCQPMTMKFRMINVDIESLKEFMHQNPDEFPRYKKRGEIFYNSPRLSTGGMVLKLKDAYKNGEISFQREEVLIFETNTPGEVIINCTRVQGENGIDPKSLSRAETEGRKQVGEIERFLKKYVVGFENSSLTYSGPFIGVRSSRQIIGEYVLTVEDLLNCKNFDDVIAHGGYPIDIHPTKGTDKAEELATRHLEWGSMYNIPYRSLVNPVVDNLITVGRCISATFEAQGGIRVTPIAGAIGHAGGTAAAIAANEMQNARDIDMNKLKEKLVLQGAFIEGVSL